VIVETHSDHVLNGVRIAVHNGILSPDLVAIHYFARAETADRVCCRVESPAMDRDGRIDRWPDGFFDEWDKSLEHLLGPARE
jgi:predicted ATPase